MHWQTGMTDPLAVARLAFGQLAASRVAIGQIAAALGASACLAAILGFPVRLLGLRMRIMDRPGERSSHSRPVPRVGGVAIILAALAGALIVFEPTAPFLVAVGIGLLVAGVSFLDDLLSLPSAVRLLVHLIVAGLTVWKIDLALVEIDLPFAVLELPHAAGLALATLFVVAFINFFNFMDGINGIAAAQGIWGGLALSVLLLWGGAGNSVITAAALAGACVGYLPHNFPRARMFMGDVGSTTLGFALAMLTLIGGTRTQVPWIACLMPLGVFLYDATFTLIKRICRGENFLKAHREHHYQLLIRAGWSHTKTTLVQMGLMTVSSVLALVYVGVSEIGRLATLGAFFAVFFGYTVLVHRTFARRREGPMGTTSRQPS